MSHAISAAIDPEDFAQYIMPALNEDSADVLGSLVKHLGRETGIRAMAGLIQDLGGDKYQILGKDRAASAVAKGRATLLIEEGATNMEIVEETGLSRWQVRQLRAEINQARAVDRRPAGHRKGGAYGE